MEFFKQFTAVIALGVEATAVVIIAFAALEAIYGTSRALLARDSSTSKRKEIWLKFGSWLLLALEFELAADIVRTAIAPTWGDIGQLAAIGLIRTFLNFFLEKDIERYESPGAVVALPETAKKAQAA